MLSAEWDDLTQANSGIILVSHCTYVQHESSHSIDNARIGHKILKQNQLFFLSEHTNKEIQGVSHVL